VGDTQNTQPATPNPNTNPNPKQTPPTYLQRVAKQLRAKRRASNESANQHANDSTLAQCIRFFARDIARDLAWRVLVAVAHIVWWYLKLIWLVFVERDLLPRRDEGVHRVVWRALVLGGVPECRWLVRLVVVLGLGMVFALGSAPLVWWVVRGAVGEWRDVVVAFVVAVWEEGE
jgi:hypothetical protein